MIYLKHNYSLLVYSWGMFPATLMSRAEREFKNLEARDLWPFRGDTGIIVDVLGNWSAPDIVPLARIVVL